MPKRTTKQKRLRRQQREIENTNKLHTQQRYKKYMSTIRRNDGTDFLKKILAHSVVRVRVRNNDDTEFWISDTSTLLIYGYRHFRGVRIVIESRIMGGLKSIVRASHQQILDDLILDAVIGRIEKSAACADIRRMIGVKIMGYVNYSVDVRKLS